MGWHKLDNFAQVGAIVVASAQRPQLIFKHSTRCSISAAAKYRMEDSLADLERIFDLHFLDLILNRDISRLVADRFDVEHQSPQVIVVHKGKAIYAASHYDIDTETLMGLRLANEQAGTTLSQG